MNKKIEEEDRRIDLDFKSADYYVTGLN